MKPKKELKNNPCKYCGGNSHTSIMCFNKPRKPIKQIGKRGELWLEARKQWLAANPPDAEGFWHCHYCKIKLTINRNRVGFGVSFLTLDHKHGRQGKLLTNLDHVVPACYPDNRLKGSQDYARFVERWYPHLAEGRLLS